MHLNWSGLTWLMTSSGWVLANSSLMSSSYSNTRRARRPWHWCRRDNQTATDTTVYPHYSSSFRPFGPTGSPGLIKPGYFYSHIDPNAPSTR